jgi:hypothetical protein
VPSMSRIRRNSRIDGARIRARGLTRR